MTQKAPQNLWLMDVRVRERNLKSGAVTDKDVDKYLAALPDLESDAEAFGVPSPALSGGTPGVTDDGDDDDDDGDGDDAGANATS
jgi:hypothetical protein